MDDALSLDDALAWQAGWAVACPQQLHHRLREAAYRDAAEFTAVPKLQAAGGSGAQCVSFFDDRVEHRGKVAGRRVNDAEHLGRRGLLLQGFARLGDQSRVLHRNDRLRRKILQQRDLLVGERANLLSIKNDKPENVAVPAERRHERRAGATEINETTTVLVASTVGFLFLQIENVGDELTFQDARTERSCPRRSGIVSAGLGEGDRHTPYSRALEALAVKRAQLPEGGLTQVHGLFEDRIETGARSLGDELMTPKTSANAASRASASSSRRWRSAIVG